MKIVTGDGVVLSLKQIQHAMMGMLTEEAALFGVPMPSLSDMKHQLVIAKRIPGRERYESFGREHFKDTDETKYVNSWEVMGHEVIVFRDKLGLGIARIPHAGWKLNNLLRSMVLRFGAITWEAEIKALQRLAGYTSDAQYSSYVLSSSFVETSKRSQVKYLFRKGAPTVALRETEDGKMRSLCSLCFHPMAYYEGTSCGCMAPTDEVIAHLVMMRGDEHMYWRKANQHRTWDARSGV